MFSLVRRQMLYAGMGGVPMAISLPAVDVVMGWLNVPNHRRYTVAGKVLVLARTEIEKIREKMEEARVANEATNNDPPPKG